MALTPGESDRLLLHLQALLARERRARGLALNVPEATALIADAVCEFARDGLDLVEARERAQRLLSVADVLPGVPEAVTDVRVEARFDDGTRLVVVPDPFGLRAAGTHERKDEDASEPRDGTGSKVDGDAWPTIEITNEASTAIGLTSHIHLAEVNPRLRLDRASAFGMRPAIPTGDTRWLLAGETAVLPMRPITGARIQVGSSGAVDGPLDDPKVRERALAALRACGYLDIVEGQGIGSTADAEGAIGRLMQRIQEANS